MKKVISFVLAVAMVLGMCSMATFAAATDTPSKFEATTEISTVVISADQFHVTGSVKVSFDNTKLKVTGIRYNEDFLAALAECQESVKTENPEGENYAAIVVSTEGTDLAYTGEVAYVDFEVLAADATVNVYDYTEDGDVNAAESNGTAVVTDLPVPNNNVDLVMGDANLSGKVTVSDVLTVLKHLVKSATNECGCTICTVEKAKLQADMDKSGELTIDDALWIAKKVAGVAIGNGTFPAGAIAIDNPFAGLTDLHEDGDAVVVYDENDEVRGNGPAWHTEWNNGVSIAYWVKSTEKDSTALISFENTEKVTYHSGDYYRYMTVKRAKELGAEGLAALTENKSGTGSLLYMPEKTIYYAPVVDEQGNVTVEKYLAVPKGSYGLGILGRPDYDLHGMYEFDEASGSIDVWKTEEAAKASVDEGTDPDGKVQYCGYYHNGSAPWYLSDSTPDGYRQGITQGGLTITTDNGLRYQEDIAKHITDNTDAEGNVIGQGSQSKLQGDNFFYLDGQVANGEIEAAGDDAINNGKWHYVVVTIKNDDVVFYVDGKMQKQTYGGNEYKEDNLGTVNWACYGFNLGYGWHSMVDRTAGKKDNGYKKDYATNLMASYGSGETIIDWLTEETTKLYLGGVEDEYLAANGANQMGFGDSSNTTLAKIAFYDVVLEGDDLTETTVGQVPDKGANTVGVQEFICDTTK